MLTRKMELFAKHYLSNGFKGADAVRAAGYFSERKDYYSKKAYNLLNHPEVKAYIDKYKKKVDDELEEKILVTQQQLLEYLSRCVSGTEKEEVIVNNKMGFNIANIQIKQADRLKAAQMIFKYYQLDNAEKNKNDNETISINVNIQEQSPEETIEPIQEIEEENDD